MLIKSNTLKKGGVSVWGIKARFGADASRFLFAWAK
jgi:hypothetical protein